MYEHNGEHYCDYCVNDYLTECTICGNVYWAEDDFVKFGDVFDIIVYNKDKTRAKTVRYDCQICDTCFDNYDLGDLSNKVYRNTTVEGIWAISNIVDADEMTPKERNLFVSDKLVEKKRKEMDGTRIPSFFTKAVSFVK